jgi:hypothetical protein
MKDALINRLRRRFSSYSDLIAQLDDAALAERLDIEKHKAIREHLWCIVGSRESYARALRAGAWCGFACSMTEYSQHAFVRALESSSRAVLDALDSVPDWSAVHEELLLDLAEHEVMHEGQIIRHAYAVRRALPSSWKWA